MRSQDDTVGMIKHMEALKVTLECDDGKLYELSADDLLSGVWKKEKKQKARVAVLEPMKWTEEMMKAHVKGKVQCQVFDESQKYNSHDNLEMWAKPKGVTVTKGFAKGKLQIPCVTNKIELHMVKDGKKQPSGSHLFSDDKINGQLDFNWMSTIINDDPVCSL